MSTRTARPAVLRATKYLITEAGLCVKTVSKRMLSRLNSSLTPESSVKSNSLRQPEISVAATARSRKSRWSFKACKDGRSELSTVRQSDHCVGRWPRKKKSPGKCQGFSIGTLIGSSLGGRLLLLGCFGLVVVACVTLLE